MTIHLNEQLGANRQIKINKPNSAPNSAINNNNYKNKVNNIKYLKERLVSMRQETCLNNEKNKKAREILATLDINKYASCNNTSLITNASNSAKRPLFQLNKTNQQSDLNRLNVKSSESYHKHSVYWQKSWLFTDNPTFEYGIA
jgi:hypothetical protein